MPDRFAEYSFDAIAHMGWAAFSREQDRIAKGFGWFPRDAAGFS